MTNISETTITRLRQRRALLWICQRHDLLPDSKPHDHDTDPDSAESLYRAAPNEDDFGLASLYWEAIWTESPKGHIISAIKSEIDKVSDKSKNLGRRPVILPTNPDEEGQLNTRELLPIYCINGLFGYEYPDGRFGAHKPIKRRMYKYSLLKKIESFPSRLLVVIGARSEDDIQELHEIVETFAPINLQVLLLWPDTCDYEPKWLIQGVEFEVFRGDLSAFIDVVQSVDMPLAADRGQSEIRVGSKSLVLDQSDLFGVNDVFHLLKVADLNEPTIDEVDDSDFRDFLIGKEECWKGFASGFAFPRHYVPSDVDTQRLADLIIDKLKASAASQVSRNETITIPTQNGTGITTFLRLTAFEVAQQGYPTLVLKHGETSVNIDSISAFLNRLTIAYDQMPGKGRRFSALIVFDADHQLIPEVSFIAQRLASQGRSVVVLRAQLAGHQHTGNEERGPESAIRGQHTMLREFGSTLSLGELDTLVKHFHQLNQRYSLNLQLPTIELWKDFQERMEFHVGGDATTKPDSLFWVALYFFVFSTVDQPEAFAKWLRRVYQDIKDPAVKYAVPIIAALSAFRIATPLSPLLRTISKGSMLNVSLVPQLSRLDDEGLITWDERSSDLHDELLRFRHPTVAQLFLKYNNISIDPRPVDLVIPIIKNLKGGSTADLWLVETFTFLVLRTNKQTAVYNVKKNLELFREIPPNISDHSKVVLHHWARALLHYARQIGRDQTGTLQSTEQHDDPVTLLEAAIEKLRLAVDLPPRSGRDENPSHLLNTLGSVYFDLYGKFKDHDHERADHHWKDAETCFNRSLHVQPDNYAALVAFGARLRQVAEDTIDLAIKIQTALHALSYFDQAEDVAHSLELELDEQTYLQEQRYRTWEIIDAGESQQYLQQLEESHDETAYLIRARKIIGRDWEKYHSNVSSKTVSRAIAVLEKSLCDELCFLSWRTYYLLYTLYSAVPMEASILQKRLDILRKLESTTFNWHLRMRFEYAVLCYQNREYGEGQNKFRELRKLLRQPEQPVVKMQEHLRLESDPTRLQTVTIQVRRVENEMRGYGFVQEFGHEILVRPRLFAVPPTEGEYRPCIVRFEIMGPIALPETSTQLVAD